MLRMACATHICIILCFALMATLSHANPCCLRPQKFYDAGSGPEFLAFSPDGSCLSVSNYGNDADGKTVTLFVVHVDGSLSNPIEYGLPDGTTPPSDLAFTPDGSSLAVTGNGPVDEGYGYIVIFNVTKSHEYNILSNALSYPLPNYAYLPRSLSFSPDGSCLAISDQIASKIGISTFSVEKSGGINVLTNGTTYTFSGSSPIQSFLAFTPDSSHIIVVNLYPNNVTVFKVTSNGTCTLSDEMSYPLPLGSLLPASLAISPDGLCVAIANTYGSNNITVFEIIKSGNDIILRNATSYPLPGNSYGVVGITFSPDGSCIVTSNGGSDISVFPRILSEKNCTIGTGASYKIPSAIPTYAYDVSFSPDGTMLATANYGNGANTVGTFTNDCGHSHSSTGCGAACIGMRIGIAAGATIFLVASAIIGYFAKHKLFIPSSEKTKLIN